MPEKITDGKVDKSYAVDVGGHAGGSEEFYLHLVQEDEENYLEDLVDDDNFEDSGDVQYPHDLLLKRLFLDPEFFKDFLEVSVGKGFADELVAGSFAEMKTDFIGKDLQDFYSDIICSARVGDSEYQFAFLIEHKSYPDKQVTFQILNYLQKLLEKSWSKKKFIQPVLAFLVYHGEGQSKLIDFDAEYSHLPEEIKPDLFGVRIREVNIAELDPEAITGNLLYISYLLVSTNRAKDKREHIGFILKQMSDIGDLKLQRFVENNIETIFYYLLNVTDLPFEEIKMIISEYYYREVDKVKTTADQLREEGMETGERKALEEMAIKQLEGKFKITLSDELKQKIKQSSIEKLRVVMEQIFEIDNLEEVEKILS